MSRVLLDTSVLIGAVDPGELEGAISVASLAALHFGTLVAGEPDEQARRAQRLGIIEATFDPLAVDASVAREWGRLAAPSLSAAGVHDAARWTSSSQRRPTSTVCPC